MTTLRRHTVCVACVVCLGVTGLAAPTLGQETSGEAAAGLDLQTYWEGMQIAQRGIEVPSRRVTIPRGETVTSRKRPELDPLGGHVGSFFVFPQLQVEEQYTDNVFSAPKGEDGDFITLIRPNLTIESDWSKHALKLEGGADVGLYSDNSDEDFEDYRAGASIRIDVTRRTKVSARLKYQALHQDRSDPDDAAAAKEPTEFDVFSADAELFQDFNRVNVRLGGTFDSLDYDDVGTIGGVIVINNDDRDRYEAEGFLRLGYEIQPKYEAFIRGAYNILEYEDAVDDLGFDRDSDGFEIVAGAEVDFGGIVFGEVFAGYKYQNYDDAALDSVVGPTVGADITWNVTRLTTIIGSASREIRETTAGGAAGRYFSTIGLSVDHELLRNLLLGADVSYSQDDFEGISRTDDIIRAGLEARYLLNRNVYLTGGYKLRARESDIAANDFTENVFLVSLKLQY